MTAIYVRTAAMAAAICGSGILAWAGQAGMPAPRAPGEQRRWALDFQVRLEQPGGKDPLQIRLSGDWISTITAVRAGEYDVAFQLSNARVTGDGVPRALAGDVAQLEQRLAHPFWATYREDGSLLSMHFLKNVDASDRNLLQMIATQTQLVRPKPAKPVWTALECDGAGSYLAIYHQAEPNVVAKRKLKYIEMDGVAGDPARALQVAVEQSELRFSLDSEGGVISSDGSDRLRMGFPSGPGGSAETKQLAAATEIHLAKLRRRQAPELIGSLARARPDVVSSPIITHAVDPAAALGESDLRLLDGHTTESLLDAAITNSGDRLLPERLAALFRRRPEASAAALGLLRKGGAQKPITDALGAGGSPAAIEALGSLMRDETAPAALRTDALTALVLTQHPSPEAMRIPIALLDDGDAQVRSTARIISGAVARAGRAEHPDEAAAIDAALIARYHKARGVEEINGLLGGLGNSVGPPAVAVIEEALRDPRDRVRAAAARALRLAPGPDVDRLLAAAIASDNDPRVRADAIFAAGFRRPLSPQLGEALVRAAKEDPVDYVRSNSVTLLRRNPGASPRIAETLSWIADNDSKSGIRRLAREALASILDKPSR